MSQTISVVEQVTATLQGADAKGNPAPLVGVPAWSSSDPTIVTVSPAADGMTAVCTAAGKLGTVTITVTATPKQADGSAGALITGRTSLTVAGAQATQLILTFGTSTLQSAGTVPAPPPPPPPPPPAG